ncbi:hypothetical protein AB0912_05805 [Streptomyces sp. NPDC007084]|uniref:hypothetical protein n=1 Tax=Streptomyces sp. NPDC007084 TaxID=3154313 RepID=UPI003454BCA0
MSVHDDLTSVQRCLDDLQRSVRRLEQHMGTGLEMRRVRADADHLRESVALLREAADSPAGLPAVPGPAGPGGPGGQAGSTGAPRPAGPVSGAARPDLVAIPDTPYDSSLWTGSDDEGLGSPHGPTH